MIKSINVRFLMCLGALLLFLGCFESPVGDDSEKQTGITKKESTETYSVEEIRAYIKLESEESGASFETVLEFVGTDFLATIWKGSDCDIINKSIEEAIEKSQKYIAPSELLALVLTMSKEAGYPSKIVIAALGEEFFTTLWLKSDLPVVKKKISDTIEGLETFISLKDLKELIIGIVNELPDSVSIDMEDLLLLIGEDFLDAAWIKDQLPLIKKLIKEYIKDLIDDEDSDGELNPNVLKALIGTMSKEAGVDPNAVGRVLGKEFFQKKWLKSDLPQIKKEISDAIELVKADTLTYDVLKSMVYQESEKAGVNYQKVMDVLGPEFFSETWLKSDEELILSIIAKAIDHVQATGEFFTYDEVKAIVVSMSDSIGLNYMEVMDTLGAAFFEQKWAKDELPKMQEDIQVAIDKILKGTDYFTYDEIKALIAKLSDENGVDYKDVIDVLTFDFLYKKWAKSELAIVKSKILSAIDVVKNGDYIGYDALKSYIVGASEQANVNYIAVMDSLGEEFLNTKWKNSDWGHIEIEVKAAIKKVIGEDNLIGYDALKLELFNMSEAAGVDYMEVMDSVGEKFMNYPWTTKDWPFIKTTIKEAIESISQKDTLIGYDSLKLELFNMSEAQGVDYLEVMDSVGEEFMNYPWTTNDWPKVKSSIQIAIDSILEKDIYISYKELKDTVFMMSDSAGADYQVVMDTLGESFFAPKQWKKIDWSYVKLSINTAIDMAKTGNKILSYDEVKAIVVKECEAEGVDYMLVMDILGEEFFAREWRISQVTWIQKETSGAIWEVKNG